MATTGISTAVEVLGVTKGYVRGVPAVSEVTLQIPERALMALLGPSGCGKTTTLRLIAGLEVPDQGSIRLAGTLVASEHVWVPPESRRVGLVFQDGALFPHLTVAENIAFGITRASRQERQQRVDQLLETIGMPGFGARYPHQLSGGQQQRVALARALAPQPRYILLDEPFANLDASLRRELRLEVEQLVRASGTTTVFVTHDQEEALSIADLIAVMDSGRVVQVGSPADIYERPTTRAVATFIGEANMLAGAAHGSQAHTLIGHIPLANPAHGPVDLLIRPEHLQIEPAVGSTILVEHQNYYGHDQLLTVRLADGTRLQARTRPRADLLPNTPVAVAVTQPVLAFLPGSEERA